MTYTFVRTSELIEAEWTELQLDNARWDIPAWRMKMDSPHIVPLSMQSVDVLRALKLLTVKRIRDGIIAFWCSSTKPSASRRECRRFD